jgi:hypothetical protein
MTIEHIIIIILLVIIIFTYRKERKGKVVVHNPPEFTKTIPASPPHFIENKKQIIEFKSGCVNGMWQCHDIMTTQEIIEKLSRGICEELLKNNAITVKTEAIEDGFIKYEASLFVVKENYNG